MRFRRDIVASVVVIVGLAAYWIGSEVHYARSILPTGITTARDYFARFGEPLFVQMVSHEGQSYYEFAGRLPSALSMATPSSPPAYVFDEQGRYVTWCRDPGDMPSHRQHWPLQGTNLVEVGLVRQRLGL
jgi:hypothetical protein